MLFVFCFSEVSFSQGLPTAQPGINPYQMINNQLRGMFGHLWHPNPGPEFLLEMSAKSLDSIHYTQLNPDTIQRDEWYKIYQEMRAAAYDTTWLDPHDTIFYRSLGFNGDTVIMNLLAFDYLTFKDSALTTLDFYDFDTINNTISDKPVRERYPFNKGKVFAAAPNASLFHYPQITFRIDPSFVFVDSYNKIMGNGWLLEIDFGDGMGWHPFDPTMITHHDVSYPGSGEVVIKARVTDPAQGGNVIMSSTSKARIPSAQKKVLL